MRWLADKQKRPYHVSQCTPEAQNETISLLSDEVQKIIVGEIKPAKMFSVLAETTPDETHIDCISCAVRFVAFQSYDFTATMSGVYKGAQAILSRELKRDPIFLAIDTGTAVEHW